MGIIQGEAEVMMQEMGEGEWCPWGLSSGPEWSLEHREVIHSSRRAISECGWTWPTHVMEELAEFSSDRFYCLSEIGIKDIS